MVSSLGNLVQLIDDRWCHCQSPQQVGAIILWMLTCDGLAYYTVTLLSFLWFYVNLCLQKELSIEQQPATKKIKALEALPICVYRLFQYGNQELARISDNVVDLKF